MKENATLPDIRHAAETGQMEQLIRSTHLEPGNTFTFRRGWFMPLEPGTSLRKSSRIAIPPTAFMTGTARMTPDEDGNCTWNRHWIPSGEFRKLSQRPGYLTEMPHFTTKEYRLDKENGLPSRTPPALPSSRSSAVPCSGTGKRPGRENSFCPRQARMPSPPQKQILFCSQQRFKQTNMTKKERKFGTMLKLSHFFVAKKKSES